MIRLKEIGEIVTGNTPPKKNIDYYNSNNIPFIKPTSFEKNRIVTISSSNEYLSNVGSQKGRLVGKGTVLVTCIGEIGSVGVVENDVCFNQQINAIKPNEDICLPKYLAYSIFNIKEDLKEKTNAPVVPIINKTQFSDIKIPLPPLPTQRKIVEVLDKAQSLIDKRKEQIELLDELIQSTFYDMFGDPVKNEMGWEVRKLKDISTKILSGTTPKGGKQVYVDDGILFLRSQNVWRNRLELDDVAYIDKSTHSKMANSSLKNKDILMTKTGRFNTENSSLGRAALFLGADDSANINGHVYLIRLNNNIIHEFVLFILTTNSYREHIRRVCVGGIDKRQINKVHLEEFPIISPPIELQNQFAQKVEKIEEQKARLNESLKLMEDNFESLMQRAFRGEIT